MAKRQTVAQLADCRRRHRSAGARGRAAQEQSELAAHPRDALERTPFPLPKLVFRRKPPSLFDYVFEDLEILDYHHHPAIKAPIAV
jgi:hypothetical protein